MYRRHRVARDTHDPVSDAGDKNHRLNVPRRMVNQSVMHTSIETSSVMERNMAFKVQVGPPQISIHQGQAILISELDGQIRRPSDKGLFFRDTRVISNWSIYANGEPWTLLNGGAITFTLLGYFSQIAYSRQKADCTRTHTRPHDRPMDRWRCARGY